MLAETKLGKSNGLASSEKHERFNFLVKQAWRHLVVEGAVPLILFYQPQ